jgi:hypothetical protein
VEIKVEKGNPIPPRRDATEVGKELRKLKVGGPNLFISDTEIKRPNLYTMALYAGIKITVRTVRDEESGELVGYRIWRIE